MIEFDVDCFIASATTVSFVVDLRSLSSSWSSQWTLRSGCRCAETTIVLFVFGCWRGEESERGREGGRNQDNINHHVVFRALKYSKFTIHITYDDLHG